MYSAGVSGEDSDPSLSTGDDLPQVNFLTFVRNCTAYISPTNRRSIQLLPCLVILAAPEDYMGTSVDLTFSKTVRRDCVTIPVRNDSIAEPPEVYTVVINSTDPDVRLPTPMSTVTIEDDDGGTLQSQLTVEIGINGKTFFCFSEVTEMFGAPSYTFFEDGIVGMVEVGQSWSINC